MEEAQFLNNICIRVAQLCTSDKTQIVFAGNNDNQVLNSTHVFVYLSESVELVCCTPPKNASDSGTFGTTMSQRAISYRSDSKTLPIVTGGVVNSKLLAANISMPSNNSMCEYMTLTIPSVTRKDDGMWACSAYEGDPNKVEIRIIVAEKNTLKTDTSQIAADNGRSYVQTCAFQGYSSEWMKGEWSIGLSAVNMTSVVGNGSYANSTLMYADMGTTIDDKDKATYCISENNTYDQMAGGNFSRTWCRFLLKMSLKVALNNTYMQNVNVSVACALKIGSRLTTTSVATKTLVGVNGSKGGTSTSSSSALEGGRWMMAIGFLLLHASMAALSKEAESRRSLV